MKKTPIKGGEESLIRGNERSYSNRGQQQKTPQKSAMKNTSEMPLQMSAKKNDETQNEATRNQDRNGSARSSKRVNSGRTKRIDVSAYSSPIAKDFAGNFFYLKPQEEFLVPPNFEDRNAN